MSNSSTIETLRAAWHDVVTTRDEARVQLHLLSQEARDRWHHLEGSLDELEQRVASRGGEVTDRSVATVHEVRERLRGFVDDHLPPAGALTDLLGDVMTERPSTCRPSDPLSRAAEIMWSYDCGVVPVTEDDGRLVGLVTDRDICMAAYTRGIAPADAPVSSVMARNVYSCGPEQNLGDALELMAEQQVHRVPITSAADGRLLGVVSMGDIARYVHGTPPPNAPAVAWSRIVGALAAISRPRATDPPAGRPG